MIVESLYDLGQTVYLKMDEQQSKKMVIGIMLRPSGVLYEVSGGAACSWHYEMELCESENILLKTGAKVNEE